MKFTNLLKFIINLTLVSAWPWTQQPTTCQKMYVVSFVGDLSNDVVKETVNIFVNSVGVKLGAVTAGAGGWVAVIGGVVGIGDAIQNMNKIEHRGPFYNKDLAEKIMYKAKRSAGIYCADVNVRDIIKFEQPDWSWVPWTKTQLYYYAINNI